MQCVGSATAVGYEGGRLMGIAHSLVAMWTGKSRMSVGWGTDCGASMTKQAIVVVMPLHPERPRGLKGRSVCKSGVTRSS